jgi:signal-transduction protein with cAMP-binding, CBS, and nucleotidyltransferase domain
MTGMTLKNEIVEILSRSKAFNVLNGDELYPISGFMSFKEYQTDEYVFTANEKGQYLYVAVEGEFVVEYKDTPFLTLRETDVFGGVALINDNLRSGSVKATMPSRVLRIKGKHLLDEYALGAHTVLKIFKEIAKIATAYIVTLKKQ